MLQRLELPSLGHRYNFLERSSNTYVQVTVYFVHQMPDGYPKSRGIILKSSTGWMLLLRAEADRAKLKNKWVELMAHRLVDKFEGDYNQNYQLVCALIKDAWEKETS